MAKLELRNLKKSYGTVEVIHGIDLTVESGEFCVFVGPSGCGKSTLLRMIAGLESISGGEVCIDGEIVNRISAAKRGLAMVFQSYALYPHMSVRRNMGFSLQNARMPAHEIDERVRAAARMLQIEPYLDRKPGQLSGGQRQRVAIGRAVVREPKIFLFDEPLSNLDAELRVATRGEIADLHRRLGNTMIYVTHDQVEAMTLADRIAVLRDGTLEQFGAPLDLFNEPANTFVAGFIGSPKMNLLNADVLVEGDRLILRLRNRDEIRLPADRFALRESAPVVFGARPSDIDVVTEGGTPLAVTTVEQLGTETFIFGELEGGARLTVSVQGQMRLARGDRIAVAPKPDRIHLFDARTGTTLRARQDETDADHRRRFR